MKPESLAEFMKRDAESRFTPEKKRKCANRLRELANGDEELLTFANMLEAEARFNEWESEQIQKALNTPHFRNFDEP